MVEQLFQEWRSEIIPCCLPDNRTVLFQIKYNPQKWSVVTQAGITFLLCGFFAEIFTVYYISPLCWCDVLSEYNWSIILWITRLPLSGPLSVSCNLTCFLFFFFLFFLLSLSYTVLHTRSFTPSWFQPFLLLLCSLCLKMVSMIKVEIWRTLRKLPSPQCFSFSRSCSAFS